MSRHTRGSNDVPFGRSEELAVGWRPLAAQGPSAAAQGSVEQLACHTPREKRTELGLARAPPLDQRDSSCDFDRDIHGKRGASHSPASARRNQRSSLEGDTSVVITAGISRGWMLDIAATTRGSGLERSVRFKKTRSPFPRTTDVPDQGEMSPTGSTLTSPPSNALTESRTSDGGDRWMLADPTQPPPSSGRPRTVSSSSARCPLTTARTVHTPVPQRRLGGTPHC